MAKAICKGIQQKGKYFQISTKKKVDCVVHFIIRIFTHDSLTIFHNVICGFVGLINYSQVYVSSPYIKNLDAWKEMGANVFTDNSIVAKEADVIFLAVKPHILTEALKQIFSSEHAKDVKNKLFISILAGVTTSDLEEVSMEL